MDHKKQAEFVRDLIGRVQAELVADIEAGRTPEDWNGVQLRALTAARFERAKMGHEDNRRLWRDYRNEVIVRNL